MTAGPGIVALLLELEKLVPEGVVRAAIAELEALGVKFLEAEAPKVLHEILGTEHAQVVAKDLTLREELLGSGQAVSFTTTGPTVVITAELNSKPAVRVVIDIDTIGEKTLPFLAQELDTFMPGAGAQFRRLTAKS